MTELTIEITNYCPYSCPFCSSNASPKGEHLDFETIHSFIMEHVNKLRNDIKKPMFLDRINISGGEPLAHPDFYKILQLCKKSAYKVHVYTNEIEYLEYNTHVLKEVQVSGNVCIIPGKDVYIPKGIFQVKLLKFISQGRGKKIKNVRVTVSRNLKEECERNCGNLTLLANGEVVPAPCRKEKL